MAIDLADERLVDPFDGAADLAAGVLRTPLDSAISFSDDPLRMARAARFLATLNLTPDPALVEAVVSMAGRMRIVSVERVREELSKMMALPTRFAFLSSTGLLAELLPAVAAAGLDHELVGRRVALVNAAGSSGDRVAARWAALLLDADADRRPSELQRLKPSSELEQSVRWLVDAAPWLTVGAVPTDRPTLRRVAAAAPKGMTVEERLEFVAALRSGADLTEAAATLTELRATEPDLDAPRPPLTGLEVAQQLGVEPGPVIGEAHAWLLAHRFEHGR